MNASNKRTLIFGFNGVLAPTLWNYFFHRDSEYFAVGACLLGLYILIVEIRLIFSFKVLANIKRDWNRMFFAVISFSTAVGTFLLPMGIAICSRITVYDRFTELDMVIITSSVLLYISNIRYLMYSEQHLIT